jgi:hypothetical protein
MTRAGLSVRPGVYFAEVAGEGVIMDLVEDRYYGLEKPSTSIWLGLKAGFSQEWAAVHAPSLAAAAVGTVDDLISNQLAAWEKLGLLTTNPVTPCDLPTTGDPGRPAARGLLSTEVGAARLSPFALASLLTSRHWVRRSMGGDGVCRTIQALQEIPSLEPARQPELDRALLRVVRAYILYRRFFDQGNDDCVPRSLALTRSLRLHGIDARVCFGVQKFPFLAHAWVEANGRAVNERSAAIQGYSMLARF